MWMRAIGAGFKPPRSGTLWHTADGLELGSGDDALGVARRAQA